MLEDSTSTRLTPPRPLHHPHISFSPVPSIEEGPEPIKHIPPPRSLSPSKPALKDSSRTASVTSATGEDFLSPNTPYVKHHSVSFSDHPSDDSLSHSTSTTPATSRESRQSIIIAKQPIPGAASSAKKERAARAAANSAATSVTSKRQSVTGAPKQANGSKPVRKPSVTETAATAAAKIHTPPVVKKTDGLQRKPSVTETAASTASKKHAKQPEVRETAPQAAAAAKTSALQNSSSMAHHYRAIAYDEEPEVPLTEAAVDKHNTTEVGFKDTEDLIPEPVEFSDDEDTISMNSESSWKRSREDRPRMSLSLRDLKSEPEPVPESFPEPKQSDSSLAAISEDGVDNAAPPPAAPIVIPTSILKKPSSARAGANGAKKPVKKVQTPASPTKPNGGASKDYNHLVLKRTPSNSSFERDPTASARSGFKMMSMRDERLSVGPGFSGGAHNHHNPPIAASAQPRSYGSRFADSDSDDDLPRTARPGNRTSLRDPVSFTSPVAAPAAQASTAEPPHKKKGFFSKYKSPTSDHNAAPSPPPPTRQERLQQASLRTDDYRASAGGASDKKKKFGGLRKVFGLK